MSAVSRPASSSARRNDCASSISPVISGVLGPSDSPTPTTHTRRVTGGDSSLAPMRDESVGDLLRDLSADLARAFADVPLPPALAALAPAATEHRRRPVGPGPGRLRSARDPTRGARGSRRAAAPRRPARVRGERQRLGGEHLGREGRLRLGQPAPHGHVRTPGPRLRAARVRRLRRDPRHRHRRGRVPVGAVRARPGRSRSRRPTSASSPTRVPRRSHELEPNALFDRLAAVAQPGLRQRSDPPPSGARGDGPQAVARTRHGRDRRPGTGRTLGRAHLPDRRAEVGRGPARARPASARRSR